MAESVRENGKSRWGFLRGIGQNPVTLKELRGRMRGGRAFLLVTAYLLMLSGMLSLIYFLFISAGNSAGAPDTRQTLGKAIFATVVLMEMILVCFIAPALTAGAISLERERQTYELLRTTLLPARSLVIGKLVSALSFLLLLLFAAFPLQSLASLFGGVAWEEVLISTLMLIVNAITFSAVGLFFSSFVKRTLASTVMAYAAAILIVFGIPLLIMISFSLGNSFFIGGSRFGGVWEPLLVFLAWVVVSINPLSAAVASEVMLLEQQKIFYTTLPLSNGRVFPIIAPWISYTVFCLVLSLILITISIRFVRRVDQ